MIRLTTVVWLVLLGVMAGALFFVKHEVQVLERQVVRTQKDIRDYQSGIRILQAEWSLLTAPHRLMRHRRPAGLQPLNGTQLSRFSALPETFVPQYALKDEGRASEQSAGAPGALFRGPR